MSRLEEIKNEVAKLQGFRSWEEMKNVRFIWNVDIKLISEKYATECVKASLEKASESIYDSVCVNWDFGDYEVDKESITNPENIVLL